MPSESGFFMIGGRYTNRRATYEVLDIGPDGMTIRYDNGGQQLIADLTQQERIVRNVNREAEDVAAYPPQDARNAAYFQTLGFLAGTARIEAIVPLRAQEGFEKHYERAKGRRPEPGQDMYYVHPDPKTDKWGRELRISFAAAPEDVATLDFGPDVDVVDGVAPNEHRVNNNRFVWRLIELGFSLGGHQDAQVILTKIPTAHREDFNQGLAAAGGA